MKNIHFRSIWISDTHLGGRDLQSARLLQFLRSTESHYLYLVGDIIDFWKLRRSWFWPPINNQIINAIMKKAENGTKVFLLPGNHDAILHDYIGISLHNITVTREVVHRTADGRRYLVLHGDCFDSVVQKQKWLANLGSILYDTLLSINRRYNRIRTVLGFPYHALSASVKQRVKQAVSYISSFEQSLIEAARLHQVEGMICGHIHHATIKDIGGVLYSNSGDWVESCTALVENENGTLGIIDWQDQAGVLATGNLAEFHENCHRNRRLAPTN